MAEASKYPRRRVVSQYKELASYWTLTLNCGHEKLNYGTPRTTLCTKCPKRGSATVDKGSADR